MKNYIHYGNDHLDRNTMLQTIQTDPDGDYRNKCGGFWGSPVDAEYGWYDWCIGEDFHTERLDTSFTFTLTPDARVLTVKSIKDLPPECIRYEESDIHHRDPRISFNYLKRYYDALEVVISSNWDELRGFSIEYPGLWFYSWDVDSILIWNPDVVVELKEKENICQKIA